SVVSSAARSRGQGIGWAGAVSGGHTGVGVSAVIGNGGFRPTVSCRRQRCAQRSSITAVTLSLVAPSTRTSDAGAWRRWIAILASLSARLVRADMKAASVAGSALKASSQPENAAAAGPDDTVSVSAVMARLQSELDASRLILSLRRVRRNPSSAMLARVERIETLLRRDYGLDPAACAAGPRGFVAQTFVADVGGGTRVFVKWLPAWASAAAFKRGLAVAERLPALGVPAAAP